MSRLTTVVALLALAAPAFAQAEVTEQTETKRDARSFLPANRLVVFECDGPARIAKDFAQTKVASLFENPRVAARLATIMRHFETTLSEKAPKGTESFFESLPGFVKGFDGRIHVAASFDFEDWIRDGVDSRPTTSFVVVLSAGSDTAQLDSFGEGLAKILAGCYPWKPATVEVDGRSYDLLLDEESGAGMSLPCSVDGHWLWVAGDKVEATLRAALAPKAAAAETKERASLELSLDCVQGAKVLEVVQKEQGASQMPPGAMTLLAELGLTRPTELRFALRPHDTQLEAAVELVLGPGPDGIFGVLRGEEPLASPQLIPAQAEAFGAYRLDFPQLWRVATKAYAAFSEEAGPFMPPVSIVERGFQRNTGLALYDDVISNLGTEVFFLSFPDLPAKPGMSALPPGVPTALCIGIALSNAEGFAGSVDHLIDTTRMPRSKKDYRGYELETSPDGTLCFTITEDWLLVGFGPDGGGYLRALIDAKAKPEGGVLRRQVAKLVDERGSELSGIAFPGLNLAQGPFRSVMNNLLRARLNANRRAARAIENVLASEEELIAQTRDRGAEPSDEVMARHKRNEEQVGEFHVKAERDEAMLAHFERDFAKLMYAVRLLGLDRSVLTLEVGKNRVVQRLRW